jgi:hypothetical protein
MVTVLLGRFLQFAATVRQAGSVQVLDIIPEWKPE